MEVEIKGAIKSADNRQVHYVASDDRASYSLLNPEAMDDYSPACLEWVDPHQLDYNLMPPPEFGEKYEECTVKHKGVPMSYLQIKTVEEGAEWYKATSKYPDEVCEMLSRYEWGDLKYTTKKEFRNLAKRTKRKRQTSQTRLKVKRGPVVVSF